MVVPLELAKNLAAIFCFKYSQDMNLANFNLKKSFNSKRLKMNKENIYFSREADFGGVLGVLEGSTYL